VIRFAFASVAASILVGCAGTPKSWVNPELGKMPAILTVHLEPVDVSNKDDLGNNLKTDSVGFRDWLKPYLAKSLLAATRVDAIRWDDSLAVVPDSSTCGDTRQTFDRPAVNKGTGWILVISHPWSERSREYSNTVNGITKETHYLNLGARYLLVDRKTGTNIACGWAGTSSNFLTYMDKSNWEDAAAELGDRIGERLPRR